MTFSVRIPVDRAGKLGEPHVNGDLPLHLLPPEVEGVRDLGISGHTDEHGISLGFSFGRVHSSFYLPAEAQHHKPSPQITTDELARRAYDAYGEMTSHKNHQGEPMPAWEDLGELIQNAWRAAAGRVAQEATL